MAVRSHENTTPWNPKYESLSVRKIPVTRLRSDQERLKNVIKEAPSRGSLAACAVSVCMNCRGDWPSSPKVDLTLSPFIRQMVCLILCCLIKEAPSLGSLAACTGGGRY